MPWPKSPCYAPPKPGVFVCAIFSLRNLPASAAGAAAGRIAWRPTCWIDWTRRARWRAFLLSSLPGTAARPTTSAHTRGYAADIRCTDSHTRFAVLRALLEVGFRRIELAPTWIHVDCDPAKPRDVAFYPRERA